jgi:flavin reductase (DIM6/NTAB) family NADH-FMN oxidoreductase RutF
MKTFDPTEHPVPFVHQLLLSGVAPRPIALVASVDAEGRRNLSPFSFFNAFGANPPVVVVSPAYRGTTGLPKHTFENIVATGEFTVSAVSYAMVHQVNLASAEYERGVNEFVKAGFTELASSRVAVPGVAESPFVMECRLVQHVDTGGKPGAGNLLVGEVVMFHVRESAYENDRIHPNRLDLVARMGQNYYCRASGSAIFELPKPPRPGVGFDGLPVHVRESAYLTGNDLARLAAVEMLPDADAVAQRWLRDLERLPPEGAQADSFDIEYRQGHPRAALYCALRDLRFAGTSPQETAVRLARCVQLFLRAGDTAMAWECALMSDTAAIARLTS